MKCDRCGSLTSAYTTSYFNTDTICLDCQEKEAAHPLYDHAKRIELEAVQSGNYNFPGIGLPADLEMNDTCHVILQDFGPEGGGWGLAAWGIVGLGEPPTPIAYTGSNTSTIEMLHDIAFLLSERTGLSTKLIRYDQPTELLNFPAKRKEHGNDEASTDLPAG